MSEIALSRCPFCGSSARSQKEEAEPLNWFRVLCTSIDCNARTMGWGLRSTATKAWNKRVLPLDLEEVLDEIKAFLKDQHDIVDGPGGSPLPNRAMSLHTTLLEALGEKP